MKFIRRKLPKIILILLLSSIFLYEMNSEAHKISAMHDRKDEIKEEIEVLEMELSRLEDYYALLNTPEFAERNAREKLGMVRTNEIIYYINTDESLGLTKSSSPKNFLLDNLDNNSIHE